MQLSETTKAIQSFIQTHPDISKLNEKEVSDFYVTLIDCIVDHNHLYYIETQPIISDKEYDELFDYLKKIEEHFPHLITSNSPTQGLINQFYNPLEKGGKEGGFVPAQHETKLLSLENTYNAQDLREWEEKAKKLLQKNRNSQEFSGDSLQFSVEPKFDGLSIELIYKNGIFTQAITRGDGRVGEDVTENVRTIKNIPKRLKMEKGGNGKIDHLSVRGEIVMPKSVWKELNKEREEEGETPFANTRNAAAGSIKLLDPKEVAKRGLLCYVYDILQEPGPRSQVPELAELGFEVFPREKQGLHMEEIITLCEDPATKKYLDQQDIEFDGLVIKVQDEQQREIIGATDHHPRRAVAYKFPTQLAATQILSVDFQVGRTGIITPVANLEPVQLSGAKLQRVSLHNFDFIKEKDIRINDRIRLQRSGEVIPYIVSVITDRRIIQNSEFKMQNEITPPTICPSCEKPVIQKDMHYYCTNPQCPEKTKQQIQHFVSKNCMDIQGIGESIVDILVEHKIIENVADIYKLNDQNIQITLRKFPGIGDKKIAEIIKGVEESKKRPLRRLLNGLGIPHVGKKMAQDIAEGMQSAEFIIQKDNPLSGILDLVSDAEWLGSIYGIGEKSVETISAFFSDQKNLELLEQLKAHEVNMDPKKYSDTLKASEAKGSFSITGSFALPREKIAEYFQQQGYIFHESPKKDTDFILIGDKAGSKKVKAEELGITIYEGWDTITQQFPFLKNISSEGVKPKTQSLF